MGSTSQARECEGDHMTTMEVAALARIRPETVLRHRKRGLLVACGGFGKLVYDRAEVSRWLASAKQNNAPQIRVALEDARRLEDEVMKTFRRASS